MKKTPTTKTSIKSSTTKKTTTKKNAKAGMNAQGIYEYETILVPSTSNNYLTLVHVPSDIAEAFKSEGVKRVVACLLSDVGEHEYQCGLMPIGEGKTGIMINKTIRTKLQLSEGTRLRVRLRNDESEYGLEMPEELDELMRQDDEGSRLFHALTDGKRRSLIYVVAAVKNSQRRIERAITVIEHLKGHGGNVDYKRLYEDLKVSKRFED